MIFSHTMITARAATCNIRVEISRRPDGRGSRYDFWRKGSNTWLGKAGCPKEANAWLDGWQEAIKWEGPPL